MQVAQDAPLKPFMDVFAIGWAFSVISFFLETTLPSKIIVFPKRFWSLIWNHMLQDK